MFCGPLPQKCHKEAILTLASFDLALGAAPPWLHHGFRGSPFSRDISSCQEYIKIHQTSSKMADLLNLFYVFLPVEDGGSTKFSRHHRPPPSRHQHHPIETNASSRSKASAWRDERRRVGASGGCQAAGRGKCLVNSRSESS